MDNKEKLKDIVEFIQRLYPGQHPVPLHAPVFQGNEKKYLEDCIDSTFVSYVGEYVIRFEEMIKKYTGAKYAVATVNGTSALHVALLLLGVLPGDEVITQALSFIGTVNSISYSGAKPVFIDSEVSTLGMSPESLDEFLYRNTRFDEHGNCININTLQKISACVPVHVLGHPCRIDKILEICKKYNIKVLEDAAESIGSKYHGIHTGNFGTLGILSFNGNKTITTGGGGMIITDDDELAKKAKHLTTTAKVPHPWEFIHDQIAYNYRMTNVNAAIGCAQLEKIDLFIESKRRVAFQYKQFFQDIDIPFFNEPENAHSNFWLNAIFAENMAERDLMLKYLNDHGIQARAAWRLLNTLDMYKQCETSDLSHALSIQQRLINLPSSVKMV